MKLSMHDDMTQFDAPRVSVPRPTLRPPVHDDEGATRVFTVPVKRLEVAPPSQRARNSFPEPPRDRPRVFEHTPQMEVTTLRPSLNDERTQLRPQMESDAPPAPSSRASIPPSTYSVPALETSVDLPAAARTASRMRIALIAAAATAAPFALVLALLGSVDRPTANASAGASNAVAQASTFLALVTPAQPAPAPVVEPASAVASAKRFPSIAPVAAPVVAPVVAPPPRAPSPPPVAYAAAAHAPRPAFAAAVRPPVAAKPAPKTKAPTASTELPDAQAADALARAQLEAALR